jgi:hypothetical protein
VFALVEVLLCAVAVVLDLFLPTIVILLLASISLAIRRTGPSSLGFRRVQQPGRMVVAVFVFDRRLESGAAGPHDADPESSDRPAAEPESVRGPAGQLNHAHGLGRLGDLLHAEMIVVGSRHRGVRSTVQEFLGGSVAGHLAHRQHRLVVVIPLSPVSADEHLPWEGHPFLLGVVLELLASAASTPAGVEGSGWRSAPVASVGSAPTVRSPSIRSSWPPILARRSDTHWER